MLDAGNLIPRRDFENVKKLLTSPAFIEATGSVVQEMRSREASAQTKKPSTDFSAMLQNIVDRENRWRTTRGMGSAPVPSSPALQDAPVEQQPDAEPDSTTEEALLIEEASWEVCRKYSLPEDKFSPLIAAELRRRLNCKACRKVRGAFHKESCIEGRRRTERFRNANRLLWFRLGHFLQTQDGLKLDGATTCSSRYLELQGVLQGKADGSKRARRSVRAELRRAETSAARAAAESARLRSSAEAFLEELRSFTRHT